jgi:fermentation-respiration switch protein FrsA (DUF1100 family)
MRSSAAALASVVGASLVPLVVAAATLAATLAAALAACAPRPRHVRPAPPGERAAYLARRGTLADAETVRVSKRGRYTEFAVRLRSTRGLTATGRLLVPTAGVRPYAAVLLNDGRELNSRAVEALPPEFGDVVVLSLDYPAEIPYHIDLRAIAREGDRLRELARRIPPTFSLGGVYLAQRTDVDPTRVAIVATSFAVPFAGIAAALDTTFRNVAFVYGAGEMDRVLAANLTLRPRWLRGPAARLAMRPFAEFEPARFVAGIAPRPVVMINGVDDPQIPVPAVRALYDALRAPKEQIWLRTGHLMPDDTVLIRALVDTALARLPVLRRAPAAAARS